MSITDWAATLSGFTAVLLAITALIRWMVKSYLVELKPNGGGSVKDTVNAIQKDLTEVRVSVARLEGRLTQHIEDAKR